jgi:hypothetical protein
MLSQLEVVTTSSRLCLFYQLCENIGSSKGIRHPCFVLPECQMMMKLRRIYVITLHGTNYHTMCSSFSVTPVVSTKNGFLTTALSTK